MRFGNQMGHVILLLISDIVHCSSCKGRKITHLNPQERTIIWRNKRFFSKARLLKVERQKSICVNRPFSFLVKRNWIKARMLMTRVHHHCTTVTWWILPLTSIISAAALSTLWPKSPASCSTLSENDASLLLSGFQMRRTVAARKVQRSNSFSPTQTSVLTS